MATVKLDTEKLKRDLKREIKKLGDDAVNSMVRSDYSYIGDRTTAEMKNLISKGISPISQWGRFPGYKWAAKANAIRKLARSLTKSRRARARQKASDITKGRYPYSVMGKYPDKQVRPVNLKLSGRFLNALKSRILGQKILIGFFDQKNSLIEEGHRTGGVKGVNDQPKRPIIPQGSETFSRSVYERLLEATKLKLLIRLNESIRKSSGKG